MAYNSHAIIVDVSLVVELLLEFGVLDLGAVW